MPLGRAALDFRVQQRDRQYKCRAWPVDATELATILRLAHTGIVASSGPMATPVCEAGGILPMALRRRLRVSGLTADRAIKAW
jgi:hypothetical protein